MILGVSWNFGAKIQSWKIHEIEFSDKNFIFDTLCNCSLRFSSSILHFRIIFISLFAFASAARDICLVLSDRLLANFLLILFFPDFMRQLKRNFNFCFTLFQKSHFPTHKSKAYFCGKIQNSKMKKCLNFPAKNYLIRLHSVWKSLKMSHLNCSIHQFLSF